MGTSFRYFLCKEFNVLTEFLESEYNNNCSIDNSFAFSKAAKIASYSAQLFVVERNLQQVAIL